MAGSLLGFGTDKGGSISQHADVICTRPLGRPLFQLRLVEEGGESQQVPGGHGVAGGLGAVLQIWIS